MDIQSNMLKLKSRACARDFVCVFAMFCIKMFVNFFMFCTIDLYNYGYLYIVYFFFKL